MTPSQAYVELALRTLNCNQRELARILGVSSCQITKWKGGEYMSAHREHAFRAILKLGTRNAAFVLWAGSIESADKWDRLIRSLAAAARQNSANEQFPFLNEGNELSSSISNALSEIGIKPPVRFPSDLVPYFRRGEHFGGDPEALSNSIQRNPYYCVIDRIVQSRIEVSEMFGTYSEQLAGEVATLPDDQNVGARLLDFAVFKIEIDEHFAPKISAFRERLLSESKQWLTFLRDASVYAGKPLRAELLKMIDEDARNRVREAGSAGIGSGTVHPDVCMNEILVGVRVLSRVLPAILEKLEASQCEAKPEPECQNQP